MRKIALIAAAAFAAGALAGALLPRPLAFGLPAAARGPAAAAPQAELAAAEGHRSNRFAAIRSIDDLLALRGFARSEALHTLAGRVDAAGLQDLIHQAAGMADNNERRPVLQVLFARLAELDPRSALALAATRHFAADPAIEAAVWRQWALHDPEAALDAADALRSPGRRGRAGQALLAAHGNWDTPAARDIAARLGIEPDTANLTAWLERLAAQDPATAAAAVSGLKPALRARAAAALGAHLGRADYDAATAWEHLFESRVRFGYRRAALEAFAQADPEAALDRIVQALPFDLTGHGMELMQGLVDRDVERARAYVERTPGGKHRDMLVSLVGQALARETPERALAWTRAQHSGGTAVDVLAEVAVVHPDLALAELGRASGPTRFGRGADDAWMLGMMLAYRDPPAGLAVLERMAPGADRERFSSGLAGSWLQADPGAALDWMLAQEAPERRRLLAEAGQRLPESDVEMALRLLPRLDEEEARSWRPGIAAALGRQRSAEEARAFVRRFAGSEQYPQLLAGAVMGVAAKDMEAAAAMTGELPPGPQRDQLRLRLVLGYAMAEPQRAIELARGIDDEDQRGGALGQVAVQWHRQDPGAAMQWVRGLPPGAARDSTIAGLVSAWEELTPERRRLVDSIGQAGLRRQALLGHVYRIARSDRQRAERLLDELALPEPQRQQVLQGFDAMAADGARVPGVRMRP